MHIYETSFISKISLLQGAETIMSVLEAIYAFMADATGSLHVVVKIQRHTRHELIVV